MSTTIEHIDGTITRVSQDKPEVIEALWGLASGPYAEFAFAPGAILRDQPVYVAVRYVMRVY